MNKFDEDLYEFATSTENFEAVFNIADKFELFRAKLINAFWENVEKQVLTYNLELNGWRPFVDETMLKTGSMMYLFNDEYCDTDGDASVCTGFYNDSGGKIILGISFNKNISSLDYAAVRKFAVTLVKGQWRLSPEKSWSFPIYRYMEDNFTSYNTLRKILPAEGDWLAKEYASIMVQAHKELYPLVENYGIKF